MTSTDRFGRRLRNLERHPIGTSRRAPDAYRPFAESAVMNAGYSVGPRSVVVLALRRATTEPDVERRT